MSLCAHGASVTITPHAESGRQIENGGEFNDRQEQAKTSSEEKARNFWTCARPVTQIVPNKRAYNRKREKDIRCKYKEGEQE